MAALNTDTSIVDYLKSTGQDSSFASRSSLATKYGISGYTGSADQNIKLLQSVKGGATPAAPAPAPTPATPTPTTPAATTTPKPDPAVIANANSAINQNQQADAGAKSSAESAPVRGGSSIQEVVTALKSVITPAGTKPTVPDYAARYKELNTTYGVTDLETQLNDLSKQEQDMQAQFRVNVAAERGKPVAQNVIEGRVGQQTRNKQEELDTISRQKNYIVNQLNTKYKVVDTLMKLEGQTYDDAVHSYEQSFAQNLQLVQAANTAITTARTKEEQATDNARANAQVVINSMNSRGATYAELPADQKAMLTKLGTESGLGADFFSSVMAKSAGKDILTTIVNDDKTQATIIYKNGDRQVIATGMAAGSGTKQTEAEKIQAATAKVGPQLAARVGEDGKISPEDYDTAKRAWVNSGLSSDAFDKAFKVYVNPKRAYDYGVTL